MTLAKAIFQLRAATDESLQFFATSLRIAIRSLQHYEEGSRVPPPKVLLWLAARADAIDRDDLFRIFLGRELMEQLAMPPGWEIELNFKRTSISASPFPGAVGIPISTGVLIDRKFTNRTPKKGAKQ